MLYPFKFGLLLGLSIIISIGAQNLFVIRQGLKKEHGYLCAFSCFLCDLILISLGASGVSALLIAAPKIEIILLSAGALFLFIYGGTAMKRGFQPADIKNNLLKLTEQSSSASAIKLFLIALSFSLLNPQAILDTLVIIGANSNHFAAQAKYLFVAGAISASFIWFFGITIATSYLADRVLNYKFWQVLEFVSGGIMIAFAIKFLLSIIKLHW